MPLWEAHDEWAHYQYVEHVARTRALPQPGQRLTEEYQYDEAKQLPLHCVPAALSVPAVDKGGELMPIASPGATGGTGEGSVNLAIS